MLFLSASCGTNVSFGCFNLNQVLVVCVVILGATSQCVWCPALLRAPRSVQAAVVATAKSAEPVEAGALLRSTLSVDADGVHLAVAERGPRVT